MEYQDLAQVEEVSGGRKAEGSSEGKATLVVCFSPPRSMVNFQRPASTAASEPGSEVSSMFGSGDDGFSTTGPLAEDLVVQGNNGVSSKMADAHESFQMHNTTYCGAIERSGHAQCLWAAAH